jgi:hypothetical protein
MKCYHKKKEKKRKKKKNPEKKRAASHTCIFFSCSFSPIIPAPVTLSLPSMDTYRNKRQHKSWPPVAQACNLSYLRG